MADEVTQGEVQKATDETAAGKSSATEGQSIGEHKGYTMGTGAGAKVDAAAAEMPKAAIVSLAQHDQLKGRVASIEWSVEDVAEKQNDQTAATEQLHIEHESFKSAVADKFKAFEALLHRHGIREQVDEAKPEDQ